MNIKIKRVSPRRLVLDNSWAIDLKGKKKKKKKKIRIKIIKNISIYFMISKIFTL